MALGKAFMGLAKNVAGYEDRQVTRDADLYRAALEKAAFSDAGSQYGMGLNQITNYLAGAGPLADSGAGTALRYKLASQVYGGARNRINAGYADFLARALAARRAQAYRIAQMQYAKKLSKTGLGGVLGGLAGGAVGFLGGGPAGAAAGYSLGSSLGGGGGQTDWNNSAGESYYG